jgi:hypothetical protein
MTMEGQRMKSSPTTMLTQKTTTSRMASFNNADDVPRGNDINVISFSSAAQIHVTAMVMVKPTKEDAAISTSKVILCTVCIRICPCVSREMGTTKARTGDKGGGTLSKLGDGGGVPRREEEGQLPLAVLCRRGTAAMMAVAGRMMTIILSKRLSFLC